MNVKSLLVVGLAAAALLLPATAALAQSSSSSAPPAAGATPAAGDPAATPSTANNWQKICEPLADGKRACIMRQMVVTANRQFVGSFILRDDPGFDSRLVATAAVPLGVMLPFGMTWQIDGNKPLRLPYVLCDPQSCVTQTAINEAYVNSLKKGGKLTLTAKTRKNEDFTVEINLAGFTTVYDAEEALSFDEYNKNVSGEAALEKTLQDRAEALRQQLESSSSSSSAP